MEDPADLERLQRLSATACATLAATWRLRYSRGSRLQEQELVPGRKRRRVHGGDTCGDEGMQGGEGGGGGR